MEGSSGWAGYQGFGRAEGWGPAGPGQSPGGGPRAKPLEAHGISHFLVAENGLKYQKILQFTVLQKRPKLHFQCNVSFLSRS